MTSERLKAKIAEAVASGGLSRRAAQNRLVRMAEQDVDLLLDLVRPHLHSIAAQAIDHAAREADPAYQERRARRRAATSGPGPQMAKGKPMAGTLMDGIVAQLDANLSQPAPAKAAPAKADGKPSVKGNGAGKLAHADAIRAIAKAHMAKRFGDG